ncbi:FGGY family carbohydrate kinase [Acuticoccus yangtzensis]|uniref:FGGY family carbohydrate kinase n=1 Tax=Acuticoccus yangtzensis TaxID=1443441 RepID=UPI000949AB53|nr:FGGY family carbohydrate kinase [Acuticoccus yangtzensis]
MSIIAIDQGTTSTRVLLAGPDAPRVVHSIEHRQIYPAPGRVEHDPEELLANIVTCLGRGAEAAGGPVTAAGLANQGESCLAWDRDTGEAITPVLVWQDQRGQAALDRLAARIMPHGGGADALSRARSGLPLDPYFSASKLGWIMAEVPAARRLAAAGRLALGTTDAFFRHRLTGRIATDITTAARTGLMALDTGSWDRDLCDLYGVPVEALPAIGPSSGDLGALTAGGRPVPLNASLTDQQAALYGHGCRAPGDAKITCGTGAFMLAVTGAGRPPDAGGALPAVLWRREGEAPVFGLDGGVYTAAAAVNWARRTGLVDDLAALNRLTGPPAIQRGLIFVPALSGLACPHWDPSARGSFVGLSLDTTREDIARALLEGIALRIAEVAAAFGAAVPLADAIPVDGGLCNNRYFVDMLAAFTGRTLKLAAFADVTAYGTASLAADVTGTRIAPPPPARLVTPERDLTGALPAFAHAVAATRAAARGPAPAGDGPGTT